MEPAIAITLLNDFVFCPKSIYFHNLYGHLENREFQVTDQVAGRLAHQTIDQQKYSTRKEIVTGLPVYSSRYNLSGKIDILDRKTGRLTERKRKIVKIYDGYRFQLYAQYFCLTEMGYSVRSLAFQSLVDNRIIPLEIPGKKETEEFENIINKLNTFDITAPFSQNPNKCARCIYFELCDSAAQME